MKEYNQSKRDTTQVINNDDVIDEKKVQQRMCFYFVVQMQYSKVKLYFLEIPASALKSKTVVKLFLSAQFNNCLR